MDRPTQDVGFRVMRCFNNPDIRHLAGIRDVLMSERLLDASR